MMIQRLTWPLFLVLAFSLPFEMVQPWLVLPPLVFTNLELLAALTISLWLLALLAARCWPHWPRWFWLPLLAWGMTLLAAALLAPVERSAALKFTLRSLAGLLGGFMTYDLLLSRRTAGGDANAPLRTLALAIVGGALLSALLGCAEVLWPAALTPWLDQFKLQTTRVAGAIRASGSFGYANIAAQFWEVALILLMTRWATVTPGRRLALHVLYWASGTLLGLVLVLSASRGGLLASLLVVSGLLLVAWRHDRPSPAGAPSLAPVAAIMLATLLVLALAQLALSPVQQARLRREVENGFMQAAYDAPSRLTLTAGQRTQTPVRVTNLGRMPWQANGAEPILLSYHWLDATAQTIVHFEGDRTVLPADVAPGASMLVEAYVLPPNQPGRYVLAWDLLQNHVAWFSTRGVRLGHTAVEVMPGEGALPAQAAFTPVPVSLLTSAQSSAQVERLTLWRAAWLLWRQRPLLGIGPDNFRYLWGDALGLHDWRPQGQPSILHSNSLYVEILVTVGLVGAAAFGWLLISLAGQVRQRLTALLASPSAALDPDRQPPAAAAAIPAPPAAVGQARRRDLRWLLGLTGAVLVFLIHGLFDYFLPFTPTYLLWWLLVGSLAVSMTACEV